MRANNIPDLQPNDLDETPSADADRPQQSDRRHSVALRNLFLDPNNYRFIDSDTYSKVPDEDTFTRDDVQRRTLHLVSGKNVENIKDLVDSFKKSGFIPVDQIQVRQLGNGRYLVVEGNRRVAALKYLQSRYETESFDLGKLDPSVFNKVPVVYYQDADEAHHLILMGLKHISGNKKWPAINQAELVRDLSEKHGMSAEDICQSISINRKEYNLTLSTLGMIDLYRQSDFADQFRSDMYSIFREITRNAALKNWLGWDDRSRVAAHSHNLDRLFSWLSQDDVEEEPDDEDGSESSGYQLEPVITRATHVRELAKLVGDPIALDSLDATRSLIQASLSSEKLGKNKLANSVSIISQELTTIFSMARHLGDRDRLDLKQVASQITGILESGTGVIDPPRISPSHVLHGIATHFASLEIKHYRRLEQLKFENLSTINIFAGINNSGKTSILEAFELAANITRFKTLFEIVCRRGKVRHNDARANWAFEQIPEFEISGTAGGHAFSIATTKELDPTQEQAFYVGSIDTTANVGAENVSSQTHFFDRYPHRTDGNTRAMLPAQYTSPYSPRDQEQLVSAYENALLHGLKDEVVNFIKENVDSGFLDVELVKDRFVVKGSGGYSDLYNFGDGVQRIFATCILFASARNGIVLMDEAESGIHSSLMERFATFLYRLAKKFNVQLLLTTHSKECIDAFVRQTEIHSSDLTAFAVLNKDGSSRVIRVDGQRLTDLVESIDFDLRRPA